MATKATTKGKAARKSTKKANAKMSPQSVAKKARDAIRDPAESARKARQSIPKGYMQKKANERKRLMGPVSRDMSYPQEKLMQLTGMRRLAWRRALESGLKVTRISGKAWVTGEEYYRWLKSQAKAENAGASADEK